MYYSQNLSRNIAEIRVIDDYGDTSATHHGFNRLHQVLQAAYPGMTYHATLQENQSALPFVPARDYILFLSPLAVRAVNMSPAIHSICWFDMNSFAASSIAVGGSTLRIFGKDFLANFFYHYTDDPGIRAGLAAVFQAFPAGSSLVRPLMSPNFGAILANIA